MTIYCGVVCFSVKNFNKFLLILLSIIIHSSLIWAFDNLNLAPKACSFDVNELIQNKEFLEVFFKRAEDGLVKGEVDKNILKTLLNECGYKNANKVYTGDLFNKEILEGLKVLFLEEREELKPTTDNFANVQRILLEISEPYFIHETNHFFRPFVFLELYKGKLEAMVNFGQMTKTFKDLQKKQQIIALFLEPPFKIHEKSYASQLMLSYVIEFIAESIEFTETVIRLLPYDVVDSQIQAWNMRDLGEARECLENIKTWLEDSSLIHRTIKKLSDEIVRFQNKFNYPNVSFELVNEGEKFDEIDLVISSLDLNYILKNLIDNALQAVDSNKDLAVKVNFSILKRDKKFLKIEVTDNGTGMSKEVLSMIRTGVHFTTKGKMGNGLGLYAVNKIINDHSGLLEIESESGMGSTFTVLLPEFSGNSIPEPILNNPNQIAA